MNVVSQPYPQDYISETLRKSAWGETPLGLYPHEGIHSDWEAIISNVSSQFDSHQREELVGILKSQLGEDGSASQRENLDRLKLQLDRLQLQLDRLQLQLQLDQLHQELQGRFQIFHHFVKLEFSMIT